MRHLSRNVKDCRVAADKGGQDVSRWVLVVLMCWAYDPAALTLDPGRAAAANLLCDGGTPSGEQSPSTPGGQCMGAPTSS